MAGRKHQNIKPDKPPTRKKRGKETDISELRACLDVLGLKIIQVTADGNCFFRALADQLEGDEDEHEKYRNKIVRFIKNNREMFEPFVEDEVSFDEYCLSMGQEGYWAGHVELQAASLVTQSNICIHRHMSPRWYSQNFDVLESRTIHLSYHDGKHYNSVRAKDDTCSGPARPIVIEGDADLSAKSNQEKGVCLIPRQEGGDNLSQEEFMKTPNREGGCEDSASGEEALNVGVDVGNKVLIAEEESRDHIAVDDIHYLVEDSFYDEHQDMNSEHHKLKVEDKTLKNNSSNRYIGGVHCKNIPIPSADEKEIIKIEACPRRSKRKHLTSNPAINSRRSQKDRKQRRKIHQLL